MYLITDHSILIFSPRHYTFNIQFNNFTSGNFSPYFTFQYPFSVVFGYCVGSLCPPYPYIIFSNMIFLSLFFIYFKVDLEDKRKVFSHTCSISFVAASMLFPSLCLLHCILWIFLHTACLLFVSWLCLFFSLNLSLSIPPNNRVMNHAVCYSEAMRCHFSSFSFF